MFDYPSVPRLEPEAERVILWKALWGDDKALETTLWSLSRLLRLWVRRTTGNREFGNDLLHDAYVSVMEDIERFEYEREIRFSSFVVKWLQYKLQSHAIRYRSILSSSRSVTDRRYRINLIQEEYWRRERKEATLKELSEISGYSLSLVKKLLALTRAWVSFDSSLDAWKLAPRNAKKYLPWFRVEAAVDTAIRFERSHRSQMIMRVVLGLESRQSLVVRLRFGLFGEKARTLAEIGEMLSLSPERVRQIEAKALHKLRHPARAKYLRDFYLDCPNEDDE